MNFLAFFADVTRAHVALSGCSHKRVSWPQGAKNEMPHQSCLECGVERSATMGIHGWVFGPWGGSFDQPHNTL